MPVSSIEYDSSEFQQVIQNIEAGQNTRLIFAHPSEEQKQKAVSAITEGTSYDVHQIDGSNLVGERHIETQGNLREKFDNIRGQATILLFNKADALYELPGAQEEKQATEEDGETVMPVDYLYQRMESFGGVVILSFQNPKYVEHARKHDVGTVVEF